MKKRHYSPDEKRAALETLHEKGGDVEFVSTLLNIPTRNLYRWRKAIEDQQMQHWQAWQDRQNGQNWQDWQKKSTPPISPISPEMPTMPSSPETTASPMPLPSLADTAFGMTRDEYIASLKTAPGELEIYHDALAKTKVCIHNLTDFMAQDVQQVPRNSLALARLIDTAILLEHSIYEQKPQPQIIKYEYPDNTFHEQPYWDNAVYMRASDAFHAVLEQAKRAYYKQQGVDVENDILFRYGDFTPPTDPNEVINQAWSADDFTNEPKSYYGSVIMGKEFKAEKQVLTEEQLSEWDKLFEEPPRRYGDDGLLLEATPEKPSRFYDFFPNDEEDEDNHRQDESPS